VYLLDESGQWRGGFLDQTVAEGSVRIRVHQQVAVGSASEQFFVRPRDFRMLLAYTRAFGPVRVLRKVRARQSEAARNDAWLSIGVGWLMPDSAAMDASTPEGSGRESLLEPVVFVATSGPRAAERLVVDRRLVRPLEDRSLVDGPAGRFVSGVAPIRDLGVAAAAELTALAGWQPEEGVEPAIADETWDRIVKMFVSPCSAWISAPPMPEGSEVRERVEGAPPPADRPSYHVFGFGQYAKVNAIANLDLRLHLAGIHEINPAQLGPVPEVVGPALDTSGAPRPSEQIENAVLAGYHHTHGPLAVELLDRGVRHVIIEKPLTTTAAQLDALLEAMDRNPQARVHAAFQRRHSPFNALVRRDLGAGPVSMSATVYEVPLPARHWYRWPVVGNSVVSNGCHWIDYFLHLNDYPDVVDHRAIVLPNQVVLTMEAASGASCAISLRHEGSPRLGVRDLISLWHGDGTVTIEDNCRYRSESGFGRSRSASSPRLRSHEDMYVEFTRRIHEDAPGDSRRSIEVSTRSMLRLADLVNDARGRASVPNLESSR